MIKYFHELTRKEHDDLVKQRITYAQVEKDYPQPEWCMYPHATQGMMGCWSLVSLKVKSKQDCDNCDMNTERSELVERRKDGC